MKNKFIALFSLSVVLFSCNPISNNLSNDFKTAGSINNPTNGQSPYKFNGMINKTDGLPVIAPTPPPTSSNGLSLIHISEPTRPY